MADQQEKSAAEVIVKIVPLEFSDDQEFRPSGALTRTIRLVPNDNNKNYLIIGRSSKNARKHIVPAENNAFFDSANVSRHHATIFVEGDEVANQILRIRDSGSLHGTYRRGERVTRNAVVLTQNDIICLGTKILHNGVITPALNIRVSYEWVTASDREDSSSDSDDAITSRQNQVSMGHQRSDTQASVSLSEDTFDGDVDRDVTLNNDDDLEIDIDNSATPTSRSTSSKKLSVSGQIKRWLETPEPSCSEQTATEDVDDGNDDSEAEEEERGEKEVREGSADTTNANEECDENNQQEKEDDVIEITADYVADDEADYEDDESNEKTSDSNVNSKKLSGFFGAKRFSFVNSFLRKRKIAEIDEDGENTEDDVSEQAQTDPTDPTSTDVNVDENTPMNRRFKMFSPNFGLFSKRRRVENRLVEIDGNANPNELTPEQQQENETIVPSTTASNSSELRAPETPSSVGRYIAATTAGIMIGSVGTFAALLASAAEEAV
ncbi:hypothetical protein V1511DRAFT_274647 [Dipodascopsis uninucleata]